MATNMTGLVMNHLTSLSPEQLRVATGASLNHLFGSTIEGAFDASKILNSLERQGRIKLVRTKGRITGVDQILRAELLRRGRAGRPRKKTPEIVFTEREGTVTPQAAVASATKARSYGYRPQTPLLNRYRTAKTHFDALTENPDAEFMEFSFKNNPMAEEGLMAIAALERLHEEYNRLSTEYRLLKGTYQGVLDRARARTEQKVYREIAEASITAS